MVYAWWTTWRRGWGVLLSMSTNTNTSLSAIRAWCWMGKSHPSNPAVDHPQRTNPKSLPQKGLKESELSVTKPCEERETTNPPSLPPPPLPLSPVSRLRASAPPLPPNPNPPLPTSGKKKEIERKKRENARDERDDEDMPRVRGLIQLEGGVKIGEGEGGGVVARE